MPTANEKALAARLLKLGLAPAGAPTAEDQLRARTWLLYQEGVPDEYKRLLDAGEA
jgi:hypothetical protein